MVKLDKIYTKGGDAGMTSLGDGRRVSKTDSRIIAMGAVDELNSHIGQVILASSDDEIKQILFMIQNDLFDIGADLCMPMTDDSVEYPVLRLQETQISWLEQQIDRFNGELDPLTSFILPSGTALSVACHIVRTIARRAETNILILQNEIAEQDYLNKQIGIYLNRLSDFFFVLARFFNNQGKNDILWVPAQNRIKQQELS